MCGAMTDSSHLEYSRIDHIMLSESNNDLRAALPCSEDLHMMKELMSPHSMARICMSPETT